MRKGGSAWPVVTMLGASRRTLQRSLVAQTGGWSISRTRHGKMTMRGSRGEFLPGCHQSLRFRSGSSRDEWSDNGAIPLTLLARNKRPLYLRDNERRIAVTSQPWHDPDFLCDAQPPEKEEWLAALLQSSRHIDIHAFVLVLKSLSTFKHGSAPKRAEHWMSRLRASLPVASDDPKVSLFAPIKGTDIDTETDVAGFTKGYLMCHLCTIQAWANAEAEDPIISVNRAEAWLNKAKATKIKIPMKDVEPVLTECHNAFLPI